MFRASVLAVLVALTIADSANAQGWSLTGNPELAAWFEVEVAAIEQANDLRNYKSLEEWEAAKPELRRQLLDMLGLDPMPERTDLKAVVTGGIEEDDFVVENLHFQSRPGLYVTANLYRPKDISEPLPAVLYVCGHGGVKKDGISYGNKAHYHHHGCWFARNGYVCLTIDSLQLAEIEAIHHGTYRYGRWWWNARGYTPAGVEAWNCVRALDYLQSRPEVDGTRLGVTGRSGGGAYSWWIAAIDDRIGCAIPVAGITSLRNHVVDGCVEGHCDCMFMVNTYRWDYATVAALVAPRPLLIANSDKDRIFPLDGVVDVHRQVAHIYELCGEPDQLGLNITEGPHKDTQELQLHAFRWLNRWLKQDDSLVEKNAVKYFDPEPLRVFDDLPEDEINTRIDENFVPSAADRGLRPKSREGFLSTLKEACFAAWPELPPLTLSSHGVTQARTKADPVVHTIVFDSQPMVPLTLTLFHTPATSVDDIQRVRLLIRSDAEGLTDDEQVALSKDQGLAFALFSPRGVGSAAWEGDEKKQVQIRRRFQLIGTTLESMQTWDIRRAIQLCRSACGSDAKIVLQPAEKFAIEATCAALFESVDRPLLTTRPPVSEVGILNLTKAVDPQVLFGATRDQ